jgi:hypothetical protein
VQNCDDIISALGGDDLQNSTSARLTSQSDQAAGPSVFPPFSGKLNIDEKLKLSNGNFRGLIEKSFNKNNTLLSHVHRKSALPTSRLLAQFEKANWASK